MELVDGCNGDRLIFVEINTFLPAWESDSKFRGKEDTISGWQTTSRPFDSPPRQITAQESTTSIPYLGKFAPRLSGSNRGRRCFGCAIRNCSSYDGTNRTRWPVCGAAVKQWVRSRWIVKNLAEVAWKERNNKSSESATNKRNNTKAGNSERIWKCCEITVVWNFNSSSDSFRSCGKM